MEEHFYIFLALLFTGLLRWRSDGFDQLPRVFLMVALGCFGLRVWTMHSQPVYGFPTHFFPTHLRMDSLFFGVLIAYLFHHRDLAARLAAVRTVWLLTAGVLLLSPAFLFALEDHKWISVTGVVLFYLGAGCLLLAAVRLEGSDSSLLKGLGALGAASYSVYLWHLAVETEARSWVTSLALEGRVADAHQFYALLYLVGAFVVGYGLNRAVEVPTLWVRDRLFPGRVDPTAAGADRQTLP